MSKCVTGVMPEALTIDDFVADTLKDVREPLKSNYISKISSVKCTVYQYDEVKFILQCYCYLDILDFRKW